MLVNGCQNADDSGSSEEDQDQTSVAMNDADSGGTPEMGNEGDRSESENGNYGSEPGSDGPGYGNAPSESEGPGYGSAPSGAEGPGYGNSPSGSEGGDGSYGAGPGGQGPGSVPQFKEGTAENAVLKTWSAIKNGEQKGLAEFISPRAKGDLAELRNGKLAKKKLDELKQQMARIKFLKPRTSGSSKTISFQNEQGRISDLPAKRKMENISFRSLKTKPPPAANAAAAE